MPWLSRRRLIAVGVVVPATLVTIIATSSVTAEPSRASNRWNHVRSGGTAGQVVTEPFPDSSDTPPVWRELHLIEVYGPRFTFVDVGQTGDSPGDYGVFRDPIYNARGRCLGTIDVQCIAAYSDQCHGSIRIFGRGQITFGGISPLGRDPDHFAVTGGTGIYTGVGGEITIDYPDFDAAQLTVKLTR